jgi:hypothetical protein
MGSMMGFFTKDFKVQYLETFSGKYYRFALMMKIIFFELLIVSLQMIPRF